MDRDSTTLLVLALMIVGGTFGIRRSSDGAGEKLADRAAERDQAESGYGSPATAAVDLIGRFFESDDPTDRSELLANWLEDWWEARRERNPEPREKKERRPITPADREDRLCEKAEEFVAIQLALVLRCVLAHLKNYLATSVAVVLLLWGMLNSYPFQPHRMLLVVGWAIGLFMIGTALWIFAACNRDEALSRLSGLHPNKIDWDLQFILAIFSYGVVPVLVLISMQFPEFGSYVYSPLEAVSKVLK